MGQLRVGFLSPHNYLDRNAWSGILYCMYRALTARGIQIIPLGNPKKYTIRQRAVDWLGRTLNKLQGKQIVEGAEEGTPQYLAQRQKFIDKVYKKLAQNRCDVIFAPVASEEINFLETEIPVVYLSDVTRTLYWKYYFAPPTPAAEKWRIIHETAAATKSAKLVYSSDWAARSAAEDLGVEPSRLEVIPFGANIDYVPPVDQLTEQRDMSQCRLLFIGKHHWQRKGGDIAVAILAALRKMGVNAELTLVGSEPTLENLEGIKIIPFLNKNVPEQLEEFNQLFLRSHFFVLPSRGDCTPIVLCEAAAFGLPVITTEVGGIPTIVQNGKNGYTFPLSATAEDYARVIAELFADPAAYQKLVYASREEYDLRLNWDAWAAQMEKVFAGLVYG